MVVPPREKGFFQTLMYQQRDSDSSDTSCITFDTPLSTETNAALEVVKGSQPQTVLPFQL